MKLPSRAGIPTGKGQSSQELMGPKPSPPDSAEILTTLLHLKKDTENWERLEGQNPSPVTDCPGRMGQQTQLPQVRKEMPRDDGKSGDDVVEDKENCALLFKN